ncbi:SAM-dependent methyltransferase [Gimesia algae]|uniref:Tellurite resistance protein TehB n=1 Tax=Gimesia algae TaxID=2527971 RepID=A0A517VJA2_9PLAN|nr:class I SAM-dependent methyltransferase [Gimesia algae]QDT93079.1 tellurite resistance protein TehB [Gimesia algae]
MWDEKYSAAHYVYGEEPNTFLQEHVDCLPKGKVLCLAEGEGRNAVFLARQGYQVTAVDASEVGLQKARRLAEKYQTSIETIHADLATFDLGEKQWDGIVSIFCHVPQKIRKRIHGKIAASLKSGGVFLLEAYTPRQLKHGTGGPPDIESMMSKALLLEEVSGLAFSHLEELEREIIEGSNHTGVGAIVQAIGKIQES